MSQSYVKSADKGTHGKEYTSEPLVVGSQSVHSDTPITYVDTLVLSLKTTLEGIVTSNTLNSESIVRWSKCHHSELQTILKVVNRPSRATFSNMHHQVDVALKGKVFPAFTSQYMPVCTKGGGNCIYHMLSLALCGTEQYMCHLRLVTAYSLIVHQQHMLKVIQPTARILLPLQKRDAASVAKAAEVQWLELLCSSITDKSWGNQFHLHALAMILERSIWLCGVMYGRCLQDEGKQLQPIKQDVTPTELQDLFEMRDKRLNNSICYRSAAVPEEHVPLLGFLDSSHFTAILPTVSAKCSLGFAPFTTFMSQWAPEECYT